VGPGWDSLVVLSSIWFPLALWGLWQLTGSLDLPSKEVAFAAFTIAVSLPHFLTTFTFTYLDPDQRRFYREQPMLWYGVPLLLITGCWLYSHFVGPMFLVTAWLLFGEHHGAAQNLGFAALYRSRNQEGEVDRRIDHLMWNTAWITTVAMYATREVGAQALPYLSRPTYALPLEDRSLWLAGLTLAAASAFALYLARQLYRHWLGLPVSVPKLLFTLTTWPTFVVVPFVVSDVETAAILRSGYHSVQYLGLVHLLNGRRCAARAPRSQSGGVGRLVALGPLAYLGIHVLAALAVWWVTELASHRPGVGNDWSFRYLFFPGVALAHFFLDGLTWRLQSEHGRRTVVPFLGRPPTASLEPQRALG
jgi:hypothetical protein